jgi:hypothetical protein
MTLTEAKEARRQELIKKIKELVSTSPSFSVLTTEQFQDILLTAAAPSPTGVVIPSSVPPGTNPTPKE